MNGELLAKLMPGVDLSAVLKAESLMHEVKLIRHEMREAGRKYDDFLAAITARLAEVQGRCDHQVFEQHVGTFGDEGYDKCMVCGHIRC